MSDDETAALLREQNALLREQREDRERRKRAWKIAAWVAVAVLAIAVAIAFKVNADRQADARVRGILDTLGQGEVVETLIR